LEWKQVATQALEQPDASPAKSASRADQRRVRELERELRRKEKALAETAALLVLSKKLEAIFHTDADA
jgi:transposase